MDSHPPLLILFCRDQIVLVTMRPAVIRSLIQLILVMHHYHNSGIRIPVVIWQLFAVMCLCCRAAHASDYESTLRFDSQDMLVGGGKNGPGCFGCHIT